jgi:hypothetical protein
MNETPSSAVTTARAALPTSAEAGAGIMAVAPMAASASDVGGFDRADMLALDDAPLDLLLRARGLVEMTQRIDAPLYATDGIDDWSGAVHDAARLAVLSAPGFDLVFDGAGEGVHLAADHPAFSGAAEALITAPGLADELVELGSLGGEPAAFAPTIHDAPVHVDVAVDDAARIDLEAPDLRAPELSWVAAINDHGLHVGEAWAWSDVKGGYVFDHYV